MNKNQKTGFITQWLIFCLLMFKTITAVAAPAAPVMTPGYATTWEVGDPNAKITVTAETGAQIRITSNGQIPTLSNSWVYSNPFNLSAGRYYSARAFINGEGGPTVGAQFTIATTKPTISVSGSGAYRTVSLSHNDSNAVLRYTLDGRTPTQYSSIYYAPFNVTSTSIVVAKAFHPNWDMADSLEPSPQQYIEIVLPNAPVMTPAYGGTFEKGASNANITLSAQAGAQIRFTTNGKSPELGNYQIYNGPIALSATRYYTAQAYIDGVGGPTVGAYFFVATPKPTISVSGNSAVKTVTLSHPDPLVTIRYTFDGKTPTSSSAAYTSPFNVTESSYITAKAFHPSADLIDSLEPSPAESITIASVGTVTISQGPEPTEGGKSGLITMSTTGTSEIWYTFNGKRPDENPAASMKYDPSKPIELTLSRVVTAQALLNGQWGAVRILNVTPRAATPIITSRFVNDGNERRVSAFSRSGYWDSATSRVKFANIEYLNENNVWTVLDTNCDVLADPSTTDCGEIKLSATGFSSTQIRAQQQANQSNYSNIVYVSFADPKRSAPFSTITAGATKTLIFSTSWIETTGTTQANRPRFGFATLTGLTADSGTVSYYYQSFNPETITTAVEQIDTDITFPYYKTMIEGPLAAAETLEYNANSSFKTNMDALYLNHFDGEFANDTTEPVTRFRTGGNPEDLYCPASARGTFKLPKAASAQVLNGTYTFNSNEELVFNFDTTLVNRRMAFRNVTIQEQFNHAKSRIGIEYADIGEGPDYQMTEQAPIVLLQDDDQSVTLVSYTHGSTVVSDAKGFAFVSDDIMAPTAIDLHANVDGQYYGYGLSNNIFAAEACVEDKTSEKCGSINNIKDAQSAYSLTNVSHDRIQFQHPNNSGFDMVNTDKPSSFSENGIYGTIELCGNYGSYSPNGGQHSWDKHLKHCGSHIILNGADDKIQPSPVPGVTMPKTWIPYGNGHYYDNDYSTGDKKSTQLEQDQTYHGPYCYDEFETIGGHKRLMLGNWENNRISKFVFLEYSFDAKGYPAVVIGKMVNKSFIKGL